MTSLTDRLADLAVPLTNSQMTGVLRTIGLADSYCSVQTPAGAAWVASNHNGISFLRVGLTEQSFVAAFTDRFPNRALAKSERAPKGLTTALRTGRGRPLDTDLRGLTEFQRDVLEAARAIPVGEVRPYGWIANRIGRPKAVRAVGTALGNNPVPLVIPCHRVTRGDGNVGQYVFGTESKTALLEHEGANLTEVAELGLAGIRFVGSRTTGIYCHPSCHQARRITAKHRILASDEGQARELGLRPCRTCEPVPR